MTTCTWDHVKPRPSAIGSDDRWACLCGPIDDLPGARRRYFFDLTEGLVLTEDERMALVQVVRRLILSAHFSPLTGSYDPLTASEETEAVMTIAGPYLVAALVEARQGMVAAGELQRLPNGVYAAGPAVPSHPLGGRSP